MVAEAVPIPILNIDDVDGDSQPCEEWIVQYCTSRIRKLTINEARQWQNHPVSRAKNQSPFLTN